MKNVQNPGGFVLTSTPFSRNADSLFKADENSNQSNHPAASTILKYDYCLPPENKEVLQNTREENMFLMKNKSNAA